MYFHQVGYFALSMEETLADRAKLAPYYYEALTGSPAPEGMAETMLALEKPRRTVRRAGASARGPSAARGAQQDAASAGGGQDADAPVSPEGLHG